MLQEVSLELTEDIEVSVGRNLGRLGWLRLKEPAQDWRIGLYGVGEVTFGQEAEATLDSGD